MGVGIWDVKTDNRPHISHLTSHICYLFVIFVYFVVEIF